METRCLVPRADDNSLTMSCKFGSDACVHLVGDLYGQLRGSARQEWSQRRLRPHEMQLAGLQSVSEERIMTGNMQNIPMVASSQRLSSDEQVLLQRKKDLLASLQQLACEEGIAESLCCLSLKPASVLVMSQSKQ